VNTGAPWPTSDGAWWRYRGCKPSWTNGTRLIYRPVRAVCDPAFLVSPSFVPTTLSDHMVATAGTGATPIGARPATAAMDSRYAW
jgi:hypothetical protein